MIEKRSALARGQKNGRALFLSLTSLTPLLFRLPSPVIESLTLAWFDSVCHQGILKFLKFELALFPLGSSTKSSFSGSLTLTRSTTHRLWFTLGTLLNRLIHDSSDHGTSKELMNSLKHYDPSGFTYLVKKCKIRIWISDFIIGFPKDTRSQQTLCNNLISSTKVFWSNE